MARTINFINAAVNYPVRYEMFEGRRHIVVPVVALVEGVHVGSGGPLFYPWSEISKFPAAWNGRPVPVYHPRNEQGDYISANSPSVIGERSIGEVFNIIADEAKRQVSGELWLDEAKTRRISPEVLEMVQKSEPIEISTGLFSDSIDETGVWNGEEYDATVINIRPDHIAVLPGATGACSIGDGCGVRANVRSSARTPSFEGTESTSWANVTKTFAAYRDAYYASHEGTPDEQVSRVQDAPSAMKNWIALKTLLGEGSANNERDLLMFPVVNPKNNKLNEGALRAVIGGRGSAANIPQAAITSAQNKARALLNRYFDADLETSQEGHFMKKGIQALARAVKAFLNSENEDSGIDNETSHEDIGEQLREWADKQDTSERINWIEDVYDNWFVHTIRIRNAATGAYLGMKMFRHSYSVDDNGRVTIGDEATEVVEKKEYVPVEGEPGTNESENNLNLSKENKEMKKDELIKALIECDKTNFEEDDRDWLNTMTEKQLEKLQIKDDCGDSGDAAKTNRDQGDGNEKLSPEANGKLEEKAGEEIPQKPVTLEEYIKAAPPEIGEVLSESVAERSAYKKKLIEAITSNKACTFTKEDLEKEDLKRLKNIAAIADVEVPEYDYSGQGGGIDTNIDDGKVPAMPPVFEAKKE
ncbi:MAG: DUF2213 domain-containing protein [Candidatus Zixiibacteriota bacterium]|nr:MAG: DUF2213 domain-containing protein [candidate division Zixibacteria bacterium]